MAKAMVGMMKKVLSAFLCILMCLPMFIGCTGSGNHNGEEADTIIDSNQNSGSVSTTDAPQLASITIAGNNIADYVIVKPADATESEAFAAEELASYIEKACGAKLEITEQANSDKVIMLVRDSDGKLGMDGFTIKTETGKVTITGGNERGVLYGAYEFLESYVGWRFLTDTMEYLTTEGTVVIPDGIDDTQIPTFDYRFISWNSYTVESFAAKRRASAQTPSAKYGGDYEYTVQRCHSFCQLCDQSASAHPFSTQPCLTSEQVYQDMLAGVLKLLNSHPEARLITVSQNDNENYCKCANCTKVALEEGVDGEARQSGPIIRFVNRIARAVKEAGFTEVKIHTFAYQYSVLPPSVTKCEDNVLVQLCSIKNCSLHALNDPACDEYGGLWGYYFNNTARAADLVEWGKICKTLYVWEYGSFFSNYYAYFPTLDVLRENCKFYAENNVKEVFLNGTWEDKAEFDELRTYLHAKVYWDPYMTDDEYSACIDDFMRGYYGDAWKEIRAYYDFLEESSNKSDYCFCDANYTTFRLFRRMDVVIKEQEVTELFEKAKAAVKADSVLLRRVEDIELTWQCALLSCRYMADYVYGSEAVRAEYQEKTKALYDKCAERGFPSDIGHEGGESPLPPYNPDQYPYQWFNADEEKRIVGNQYV